MTSPAEERERDAWVARQKHAAAAETWRDVAGAAPDPPIYEVLADWMTAYADADAVAERRFREIAAASRPLILAVPPARPE